MKKLVLLLFIAFSGVVNAQNTYVIEDKPQADGWSNNASTVFQEAKEQNAMILFNFTGSDWCVWCKKIKAEIFETDEFKKWVADNNVKLLELDFPRNIQQSQILKEQNSSLRAKFGVRGYPTIFAIKDGKVVRSGYIKGGAKAWIDNLEEQFAAQQKAQ